MSIIQDPLAVTPIIIGTNLIHDFTDVTFSVKNAYFREIRDFFVNFNAFLSFMKVSEFYQQHLCGF